MRPRFEFPPRVATSHNARPLPLWIAIVVAAAGGLLNSYAFPGRGWWPLAFLGTALILWSLIGRNIRTSLLVGFVAGAFFFGNHILWLTIYLGPVPWMALAGLEAIFFALGAALIALAWRFVPVLWPGVAGRILGLPLVLAGLWTLREAITAVWPYGGFSWGRLAFSQSASPFAHLVAWFGISGVSFLIAWLAGVILQAVREVSAAEWPVRGILASGAVLLVMLIPSFPVTLQGSIRVAAVQGNSKSGLFSTISPGEGMADHLNATLPLFGEKVDLLVWPENAADLDPQVNAYAEQTLDYVTSHMKAPLITGTVTQASGGRTYNSLLLWESGKGTVAQYDKIHPVPFAEYLPNRSFWYPLAPSLFDMVPRDYSFGTRSNVFDINGAKAGLAICFDIVDDGVIDKMMAGGAEFIVAPTNNADFGHSDESEQQLAIARLRAIETGRSLINDSTVGVSAMFNPDGSLIAQLPTFKAGSLVENVPLSTTTTLATVAGRGIEWFVCAFGLIGLLLGLLFASKERRNRA